MWVLRSVSDWLFWGYIVRACKWRFTLWLEHCPGHLEIESGPHVAVVWTGLLYHKCCMLKKLTAKQCKSRYAQNCCCVVLPKPKESHVGLFLARGYYVSKRIIHVTHETGFHPWTTYCGCGVLRWPTILVPL